MIRLNLAAALLVVSMSPTCLCASKDAEAMLAEIHLYASEEKPLENKMLFEGDILPANGSLSYNAISESNRLWPNNVIYYEIDHSLQAYAGLIERAIQDYHQKTCLRFQRGRGRGNFVKIFNGQGCYANVGMVGGEQPLSLGQGCHYQGTVVHELGHVAGFYHEHTRSDRDQYIDIYWPNIDQQYYPQFQKLAPSENLLFNRFDYNSVMLYGSRSFSNNGRQSMTQKDGGMLAEVHDKSGLSAADVERVNQLYKCNGANNGGNQNEDSNINQLPQPNWPPQNPDPWGQWGGWGHAQTADSNKTSTI